VVSLKVKRHYTNSVTDTRRLLEKMQIACLTCTGERLKLYVQDAAVNRKLTLSLDSKIVDFAHDFSKKTNRPISKIIENYFRELKEQNPTALPKDLEELYGIFEGADAPSKKELRAMFHEKNRN